MHIYIYIYTGWNWDSGDICIRLGFCCGTPFFARRAQYKDAGGMRERQRKRNRHKGGWVHRSETRACLSTPQCARKYTLPGIYYYTYIPLRPIRKNRRETRNLSRTISSWKMNLLLSLCRVRVPCIECAAPRKISRPSCINGKSIYEYILQCKSDIDCRGDLSGTVTMLMLQ